MRRATEGLYPPGSTFKVVTASAGLQAGDIAPDTVFEDNGNFEIEGHFIEEANRRTTRLRRTLTEGFAYSLNVVFAQVGLQIGRETLEQRAAAYGIGATIPFDEPIPAGQLASTPEFSELKGGVGRHRIWAG